MGPEKEEGQEEKVIKRVGYLVSVVKGRWWNNHVCGACLATIERTDMYCWNCGNAVSVCATNMAIEAAMKGDE